MTTNDYPPISPGTLVRTTQPNVSLRKAWTDKGWARRRWDVQGTVLTHHDSHGLYYDVRHEDGSVGGYDPSELEVVAANTERKPFHESVLDVMDTYATVTEEEFNLFCKFIAATKVPEGHERILIGLRMLRASSQFPLDHPFYLQAAKAVEEELVEEAESLLCDKHGTLNCGCPVV